ncbi:hypothetical protein CDL15_Pgr006194 [Punica granatum]|uniref:Uncharacterized protein n=1 Tax=Punica granatum TaxID=22663 RepID=A0A218XQC0_PUNGR|nr:hypothetical protein CDL15_Pgr006194 [Punica granatum]
MTFRNSTGFPEGRFNGSERLPTNLRGTFTENRDHSGPRTPQDIRETLKKPRSQVPRSLPGQRSSVEDDEPTIPREAKGSPKRAGQNRLSRRRAT